MGGTFTQPAMAECTVTLEACGSGNCVVNTGTCTTGGACTVNMSTCEGNSACTLNLNLPLVSHPARCSGEGACTINSGDCNNKDGALICLNTICDGTVATSEGYTGFTCGLGAGQVSLQDPSKVDASITGGPWIVTTNDPVGNTIIDVTITCTVQVNGDGKHGGAGVARNSTTSGNVGTLADTISFHMQPTDKVYICSKFEWNSTKGHSTVLFDIDNNSANGLDCEWANDGDPIPDN